ncbi:PREDICTED: LOW QUALITY PROTEIN: uncharacterized protein C14orf37 homolog [Chrysochloris asiatica]|uniref:LOW QUALITY PROTEIN: uncharacterized protein C14orf37 homolog n=1 Tax=Chrysochloris asiatica TaxID=185453 RepID=A0A9B0TGT5_CHRAS|nr:PREDICTED: LOW QUALITY PROTEIN: uncharacterized protein C14orf37 homolog [Chrysochloris asiatica]
MTYFSSAMSRPIILYICLAFCSLLVLNFHPQCLAFPKMERREIAHIHAERRQSDERTGIKDLENKSRTSGQMPQLVVSEDSVSVSEDPSGTSLNEVSPVTEGTHAAGGRLTEPIGPGDYIPTKSVVPTSEEELFGPSQPERTSPESCLSKARLATAVAVTAPLNTEEKEDHFSSTNILPTVEVTTEATQGFLKHLDGLLFASESQEEVSVGYSTSSHVNTKETLTTNLRIKNFEAATEHRATSLPGSEPTASTEPENLTPDREKSPQTTADKTHATATKHLVAASEVAFSVEPETDSLPGFPGLTASISTAVPTASVLSDEWDDTKLERVSQIRTPNHGDNTETQMRMETFQTVQVTPDSMEGVEPLTGAADMTWGLPEGEAHTGTPLLIAPGAERSAALMDQSSFTPTSPMEDVKVSVVNLVQNTAGFVESTTEKDAVFSLQTTVSISGYESDAYQPLENTFKDITTQEMTTAVQEAEATLSLVTQEQISVLEVTRGNGETEEGSESPSSMSGVPGVTQLLRRSEPLASSTTLPLSLEVTPTVQELMDTVTGPNGELLTPVLGFPVTLPGIMEEMASISLVLPASEVSSERRTIVPSVSRVSTAATYGLDQLESEEGEEDEDEEDEDEEEEDEEEDEEDKDTDSLDESLDSDTELPGFTLPGITSQEPGLEQRNLGTLGGATYQVPDAIEWEQQNQGLVRSWMAKLKDKAGYLSGMLVPVGVGIAGALFILGALYSIKVMNRRRRNGFKRHKRKQREFNSMQDRVMLLADSSEDEF